MSEHKWFYIESSLAGENQIGPVSEQELKRLALAGKLKPKTQIISPTRTKNQWSQVSNIAGLMKLLEQGKAQRKDDKLAAKEYAAAEKQHAAEQKRLAKAEIADQISDGDGGNPTKSKIENHVSKYLTKGEEIEFVCMQTKPIAIKADGIVVTTKRLLIVTPKMLGRFEFVDFLWRDLGDAHVKENALGATFSLTQLNGQQVSITYLPKDGARKLYQIAQEREEEAIETRRQRKMEETSAGAARVNVGVPQAEAPASQASDPVERLKKLKSMFEAELISEADFEKRKQEILGEL